jgi:dTDP-4-dehydrorhamnose reductase
MERIRAVNPGAKLVQTDDLGKVFSTRLLAYQAKFENERRWLTYDLLCGRVRQGHPLWNYLRREASVPAEELQFFLDNPCPPDIIGINYYLTSERLLDERVALYPPSTHGGNGRHAYADVEAVRLRPEGLVGPRALLMEAWERYHLPLAVTEVHNGCTREEQLRWLLEVWNAATEVKASGVDLRAVTVWALLGAFNWNSLVTRSDGCYEPGAFDVRSAEPRPTALATMARELAHQQAPSHPVLDMPGWWRRSKRVLYPNALVGGSLRPSRPPAAARPLVVTGASGTLGQAFARLCELRGLAYRLLTRSEMDIADEYSVEAALALHGPWAVINTAGYVRVDEAELDPERCSRENSDGPEILAKACRSRGIRLVTFSSDLVFSGNSRTPYTEASSPDPLNVYGATKATAERRVLSADPTALVIRTSAFFGPWDEHNFVTRAMRQLLAGQECEAVDDAVVSPTYVPDLVNASLDLVIDGESGLWHLANVGEITWAELARTVAGKLRLDSSRVVGRPLDSLGSAARRPVYSALTSHRASLMPTLEHAIDRYLSESEFATAAPAADAGAEELLGA